MSQRTQARRRMMRFLVLAYLLVMAAKLAIEIPADRGWIEGESLLTISRGVAFVLNLIVVVVACAMVIVWPVVTRYGRAGRTLMGVSLGLLVLGATARQFGLFDWLERQGRIATRASYLASTLAMAGLLLALVVVAVLDLQERTNRDIRTRLHGKGPSNQQGGAVDEASRPRPEPRAVSPSRDSRS